MNTATAITTAPRHLLHCHPACQCGAVRAVAASADLTGDGALALSYRVHGARQDIRIPEPVPPAAADNLWQHTCFEALIAAVDRPEYREFNFSPSGQWASYRFADYRQRDLPFVLPASPQLTFQRLPDGFQLDALLAADMLPPPGNRMNISLSAVIEANDGSKSYWALTHCAAQPDFHLRQSFTLALHMTTP